MKTQNKRAQSAVEYLMTYGWAILVIIVVGAALWKLGVFDVSKYTGSAKLAVQDFTVAGSQLSAAAKNVTIKMGPNQQITVTTFNVQADGTSGTCSPSLASTAWSPNDEKTIRCNFASSTFTVGTTYQVKVNIDYSDANGFAHIVNATYNPKAE